MRKLPLLVPAFLLAAHCAFAQTPATQNVATQAATPPTTTTTPTLHATSQLVVVDVVVTDRNGKPVHSLKREDFVVSEDKHPQTVSHFEEHSSLNPPAPGRQLPPMPPGVFTDYTPVPENGSLNVLLLDSLNTAMTDQSYVRYELQQFVKKAPAGTRIAIFGLARQIYILQGFTSDPAVLKDAVDHKLIPRASSLLDDPAGSNTDPVDAGADANLAAFEGEMSAYQDQLRTQYTLDGFNALAHYLVNFPGRKNLIWFSTAFPLTVLPDDSADPFALVTSNEAEYSETVNLLSQADVSVYPVDAAGLAVSPVFSASRSGRGMSGAGFGKALAAASQKEIEEHLTMNELAEDTGGNAFYNNNDLAHAVNRAIDFGSNYYTMSYPPSDRKQDGGYRSIKVALTGNLAGQGYSLAYRRGYFADSPPKGGAPKPTSGETTISADVAADPAAAGGSYARTAMARGAPAPSDLLFKVRVLPATTTTDDTLAPGNTVDPVHPIKPPFRRYDIDFATLTDAVKYTVQPDGKSKGGIEFIALLYDPQGVLLNEISRGVSFDLTPDNLKRFQKGMGAHLEISAPAKGDTYLRVAVHDLTSNRFGVVEIPISAVSKLAPPPPPAAAAPSASPSPSAAPPTAQK